LARPGFEGGVNWSELIPPEPGRRETLGVAALLGILGIAQAAAADLPAGLASPDHGVVCDSGRGACFDRFGPSIGLTEAFLGPAAARALTAVLRDAGPDHRPGAEFSPADNVRCRRETGPCRTGGVVDDALTAVLYGSRPAGARRADSSALGSLPATYTGVLPCADCPGIEHHLDLFPDRAYYLRRVYQDRRGGQFDEIGAWEVTAAGRTLVLHGEREERPRFAIKDAKTLTQLEIGGRPIVSAASHDLERASAFDPIAPRLAMRGMFRYMADAAIFEECLTRRKLPVLMQGDYLALEKTYTRTRREPGAAILATLHGRIVERAGMEGPPKPSLLVERFEGLWPGETCGVRFAAERLQNTYWKLVRLRDEPVLALENQREPHIILRTDGRRVAGSGGCNSVLGGYRVEGSRIEFGKLAMTLMACPAGMEQERSFLDALGEAVRWRVMGSHLELFDAGGARLARLEAVHLK
jgi:copper homeostasis protein (lipoprotein)